MSSDSEDDYNNSRQSKSKREHKMHSSRYRCISPSAPLRKMRLHDERHRSPSPYQHKQYSSGERSHGRLPSPRKKMTSRDHGRESHREDRRDRRHSSSPESQYSSFSFRSEGFRQDRISSSGRPSPSPPRSLTGNPNIPERRTILKQKTDDNVLEKMEHSFTDGPLEVLKRCVHQDIKVMVWIRNQVGIRGICTGYVVAFDKFWNLVMRDVDEAYQKCKKPKCPYLKQNIRSDDIPEAAPIVKLDIAVASGKNSKTIKSEKAEKDADDLIDLEAERMETENTAAVVPKEEEDPEKLKKKLQRKQKKLMKKMRQVCKRNINSMLIRGDNIVLIRVCN